MLNLVLIHLIITHVVWAQRVVGEILILHGIGHFRAKKDNPWQFKNYVFGNAV